MRKEMRRKEREISKKEALKILESGVWGTVAVNGDDGYPYGVPVNYVMVDGKVIFHSAKAGYKFEAIKRNPKVSFTVVLSEEIIASKFTSNFESVVFFGEARIVEDEMEKEKLLMALVKEFHSEFYKEGEAYVKRAAKETAVIEIKPLHVSGKRNFV